MLTLSVEVRLRPESQIRHDHIIRSVSATIQNACRWVIPEQELAREDWEGVPILDENVERIYVAESGEFDGRQWQRGG